jgi:hypothetical protein
LGLGFVQGLLHQVILLLSLRPLSIFLLQYLLACLDLVLKFLIGGLILLKVLLLFLPLFLGFCLYLFQLLLQLHGLFPVWLCLLICPVMLPGFFDFLLEDLMFLFSFLDLALELGELLLQQLELPIELLDFLSGLLFSQFEVV